MPASSAIVQEGDVIGGRFILGALAGQGGMGSVFRAHDRVTRKPVAVKVLAQHDADAISRFDHEARILAELGHPHIVEHVAHGATKEGAPYLVMEWLEGQSLTARLLQGRLPEIEAITLATNIASALAAAHARGIVHRDVKPSNIFLVDNSVKSAKVLDFGLAQATAGNARLTRTGTVIGTPGYMAPEQAQGSRGRTTTRADVFSLGALLFECLTGKPAFEGDGVMAILARVLLEDAPRVRSILPEIPDVLDTLVARMLSRIPEARPADGAQVLRVLEQIGRGHSIVMADHPRPPVLLGDRENGLACVILAAAVAEETTAGQSSPTLRTDLPQARWNEMQRVAARHGGIASEIPGGGLLIRIHGTDDLSIRAARCALAVAESLQGFRVALVTGCADAAQDLPYAEIVGRAIQLLEFSRRKKSTPGVRIGGRTHALLDAHFEVQGPSDSPRLCRERQGLGTPKTLCDNPTPFVGRKREIETLVDLLVEGFDEGEAATALVVGQAGMGKSRLAGEVIAELRTRKPDMLVGIGRSDVTGADYSMLTALVRHLVCPGEGASRAEERRALAAVAKDVEAVAYPVVEAFFHDEYDDDVALPSVLSVRDAWLDLLCRLARRWPLLVVIEDAQWADTASLDLLQDTLARIGTCSFGVLALARPEVHERGFGLLFRREVQEIRLGPISAKAGREFVTSMLGASESSDAVIDNLVARSEGHPMLLEESIRAVIEDRSWFAPETLLAVHGPQMVRLASDARQALRLASLVGVTFWLGAVLTLQGEAKDEAGLRRVYDQLVTSGIIARRRTSRVPHDLEYMFAQPSVREAFLATWTDEDRNRGQAVVQDWLAKPEIRDAMAREQRVFPAKRKKTWC